MVARVLVTGASGFVGSHLVPKLLTLGFDVAILSRHGTIIPDKVQQASNLTVVNIDSGATASDYITIFREYEPDAVMHLASLYISEHTHSNIEDLVHSNILLGTQLLEAMVRVGCTRFVNVGTSWQYYHSDSYCPVNLYAATKQAFIDIAKYYIDAHNIQTIDLKLYDTYGEYDKRKKLIPYLVENLGGSNTLSLSEGKQLINIVHVDDVVNSLVIALERLMNDEVNGYEEYAVGAEQSLTLRNLVALLEELSGAVLNVEWGARPYREREVMRPWGGGAVLKGWQQKISLDEGLMRVVKASRDKAA